MAIAIVATILGLGLDYINPRVWFLDWVAAWFYMPAALAWIPILRVDHLADTAVTNPFIRWTIWALGLTATFALLSSMILRKLPIIRKVVAPITDEITGLGGVDRKGLNERLITCIAVAAIGSLFAVGGAADVVADIHQPVRDFGEWAAQEIGIDWLGFPGKVG